MTKSKIVYTVTKVSTFCIFGVFMVSSTKNLVDFKIGEIDFIDIELTAVCLVLHYIRVI